MGIFSFRNKKNNFFTPVYINKNIHTRLKDNCALNEYLLRCNIIDFPLRELDNKWYTLVTLFLDMNKLFDKMRGKSHFLN